MTSSKYHNLPDTLVALLQARAADTPDAPALTFLEDGEAEAGGLTYAELDRHARAIARELQNRNAQGKPVLMLYPSGIEFVTAFYGCLYAGALAVPAYPPGYAGTVRRLEAIAGDAQPYLVLTGEDLRERLEALAGGFLQVPFICTDRIGLDQAGAWQPPQLSGESLAFLQYTSGSTASPRGVMVSHGNLIANISLMMRFAPETRVFVNWLPLYHDMGLIGTVLHAAGRGAHCVLMAPTAFLLKPRRWLEAMTRYRAGLSGAPNFAYDLCVRKIPDEERGRLDLSALELLFNGAEPVRPSTMQRFIDAFGPYGFRPEAFMPCYGLAEATLIVSGDVQRGAPLRFDADAKALEQGRAEPASPGVKMRELAACGSPLDLQEVRIVEPESRRLVPEGQIGEIWVRGPCVTHGYWRRDDATEATFHNRLADGSGPRYLRSGDLGFLRGGELYIAGRAKDLIIVRGANHYPQDLEVTATGCHELLRPDGAAAFAIDSDGEERVVIAAECFKRRLPAERAAEVFASMRRAIAAEHELEVHDAVLIAPGSLPRTSSGKVQRGRCRKLYLAEGLKQVARANGTKPRSAAGGVGEPLRVAGGQGANGSQGVGHRVQVQPGTTQSEAVQHTAAEVMNYLRTRIARRLKCEPESIREDGHVFELGLDSLRVVELIVEFEKDYGIRLHPREFFERPTLRDLADHIARELAAASALSGPASGVGANGHGALRLCPFNGASRVQRAVLKPESRVPGVVFLLSSPRSGSTLLRVMLAGHPQLFCPPELHLLPFNTLRERAEALEGSYLDEGLQRAIMELRQCSAEESAAIVRDWTAQNWTIDKVYTALQSWTGGRLLVDKSPTYGASRGILDRARQLCDTPRFIHLVRHPYAVIESMVRNRFHILLGAGDAEPVEFADYVWAESNANIADVLDTVPEAQWRRVRYESLVTQPEPALAELCALLEVPFHPSVLNPFEPGRMTDGLHAQSVPVGDPTFQTRSHIDPSLADAWQRFRNPAATSGYTRRVARELGYSLDRASATADSIARMEEGQL